MQKLEKPNRSVKPKRTKKNQAYEAIKKIIISHKILSEEPVTELSLSKSLRMGRTPIREALNLLSRDGLITLIPNKGFILNQIKNEDLIYIYQIREALDPLAAKLAAKRIQFSMLEEIERKFHCENNADFKHGRNFSRKLHSLIYKFCGNPYLIEIFKSLNLKIDLSRDSLWDLWKKSGDRNFVERRYQEHMEIIRLLKEGDAKGVETLCKTHMANTIKDLVNVVLGAHKAKT